MSFDLSRALRDAADRATADRAPLAAAPVVGRIHRRRTARATTASAVGAAAVGAVVLGGIQLADGPEPPPPATTPTPAPVTRALPVTCGTVVEDVPPLAVDGISARSQLLLPADADRTFGEFRVGEAMPLELTTRTPADLPESTTQWTFVAVADGVVVGVADPKAPATEAGEREQVAGPDGPVDTTVVWDGSFVSCGADDGEPTDEPLGGGTYEIYGVVTVPGAGTTADPAGVELTGPHPVTVLGTSSARAALPTCGEPVDGLAPTSGPVTVGTSAQVGVVEQGTDRFLPEGHGDVVLLRTTYVSDSLRRGLLRRGATHAVLARDGVVVADAEVLPRRDAGAPDGVATDESVQVATNLRAVSCEDDSFVGPGDYVLWVATEVSVDDGPVVAVVNEPVPLTIFDFEDPDNPGPGTWTPDGFVQGEQGGDLPGTEADGLPALDDVTLGLGGLDVLPLGTELPAPTSPTPLLAWDADRCQGTETPGAWVATYPDVTDPLGEPVAPYSVIHADGTLVRVEVEGQGIRTADGVTVGSTLAELLNVLDVTLLVPDDGSGTEVWGVRHGDRLLTFDVATDAAGERDAWPSALKGTVVGMAASTGLEAYPTSGWEDCG